MQLVVKLKFCNLQGVYARSTCQFHYCVSIR